MREQDYYFNLMDVAHAIRECGASQLWRDLKEYYPEDFDKLLYAAQDFTEMELASIKKKQLLALSKLSEIDAEIFPLGVPDFRDSINADVNTSEEDRLC